MTPRAGSATGGLSPAATRKQSTGTAPAGKFAITEAFGLKQNPNTSLPWKAPTGDSYWVLDPNSQFYNQLRQRGQGGFRTGPSERLVDFKGQYGYAAVIDYNRAPAVKGKGGAIFLHVHGQSTTAGCVSITSTNLQLFLQAVTSGDEITIQ
ncbi:MAG: L,D-transpeptidase family protein [Propionibacteriaceae bacterium]|nr:L,D-transpeptidase family protein [Propionibacteriaceae bacterium]